MTRIVLICAAVFAAAPASAQGLTVRTGETWLFQIAKGQPVRAHKAVPNAEPGPGQVLVTVRAMMGTTMTITNDSPISYTYRATLIGPGKETPARSCTLPANHRPAFEHWPQRATAIRLSDFKPAASAGHCP